MSNASLTAGFPPLGPGTLLCCQAQRLVADLVKILCFSLLGILKHQLGLAIREAIGTSSQVSMRRGWCAQASEPWA